MFGFFGEVKGGVPPLFKLLDAYSLRQAPEPKPMVIPTWSEWNVHYGVGPERNLIPIQGEELMTVDTVNAGRISNTSRLHYIPRGWAPYFIGEMSPESAMRLVRQLITGLRSASMKSQCPWNGGVLQPVAVPVSSAPSVRRARYTWRGRVRQVRWTVHWEGGLVGN